MTGAPAPRNADAVIKIESARHLGEDVWRLEEPRIGPELYLAVKGSEARKGALLARAGQQIDARLCGTMAASGHAKPKVIRRLKVSSIVTGNEVVPLDATPGPAGIRDTNGTVLSALLSRHAWIEHARAEMVRDEERLMKRRLRAALGSSDCVLLSGGVSMGERDLVPEVLRDLGVRRVFHKLAMRPGKPIWFGVHGENTAVFGLPGHPVSVQVTFHEFALPGMRIMGGFSDWQPRATWLPAGVEFNRRVALRSYILCRVKRGERGVSALYPVKHRGSGDFASAVPSEGVAILPEGSWRPQEGEPVEYHAWDAQ